MNAPLQAPAPLARVPEQSGTSEWFWSDVLTACTEKEESPAGAPLIWHTKRAPLTSAAMILSAVPRQSNEAPGASETTCATPSAQSSAYAFAASDTCHNALIRQATLHVHPI